MQETIPITTFLIHVMFNGGNPMASTTDLNLKTAIKLVDEVTAEIEPLKQTITQHNASLDDVPDSNYLGFLAQGFKGKLGIARESNALLHKCEQAISLASGVIITAKDARVLVKRDGEDVEVTPQEILAHSHLCKGVIFSFSDRYKDAETSFEESVKALPIADARLRLAYAILMQGERDRAIKAFQKVINEYPEAEEAVEANRTLLEVEKIKPKRWKIALPLSIFLGWLGIDRFYLGYYKLGFIKLITIGGFYIWWIVDILRILGNTLRDSNGLKLQK